MFPLKFSKISDLNSTFSCQDGKEYYRCKYQKKERSLPGDITGGKDKSIYANCLAKPVPGRSHLLGADGNFSGFVFSFTTFILASSHLLR